ncbi:MAG: large conductance mechanosensitive channel protein MscL [Pirellula sp.]|jgi:large conductance mechanosensitive channel
MSMGFFSNLAQEFKKFALRGNVIDLAVGVVIGTAFTKIVNSLVSNLIMPPLNLLTSKFGVNFADWAYRIRTESPKLDPKTNEVLKDAAGKPEMIVQDYPILKYGPFIETVVDFLLISAAVFLFVKAINTAKAKLEKSKVDEPPPEPTEDVLLLREIRDALAGKK